MPRPIPPSVRAGAGSLMVAGGGSWAACAARGIPIFPEAVRRVVGATRWTVGEIDDFAGGSGPVDDSSLWRTCRSKSSWRRGRGPAPPAVPGGGPTRLWAGFPKGPLPGSL